MATTNGNGNAASLNTIAAQLASLTATVSAVQGQVVEVRQEVRDVKTSLGSLVPQAVYDVTVRDLAQRVQSAEGRWSSYVSVDAFAARVKAVDSDLAEIRDTLNRMPDAKRQNMALWLSGIGIAAAVVTGGGCGLLSVVVTIAMRLMHI